MAKWRWQALRFSLWLMSALLLLLAGLVAFNSELRSFVLYKISPTYARNSNFIRLDREDLSIFLLGTIHGAHLNTPEFSLAHLDAVIVNLKPDLLLVEARPEQIAKGRWGDGPIEMPFCLLTAREAGIAAGGFDWWQLNKDRARRTDQTRDDRMFQHLYRQLPRKGDVLVLVGYSHVAEVARRLRSHGFKGATLTAERKAKLFATLSRTAPFPPGMKKAIERRIADARQHAAAEPTLAEPSPALAASRERYLQYIRKAGERPLRKAPPRRP